MSSAIVPSSHIVCPASRASEAGLLSESSGRFSAPFCCSVAASANRIAATRARIEAIAESVGAPIGRCNVASTSLLVGRWRARVLFPRPALLGCRRGAHGWCRRLGEALVQECRERLAGPVLILDLSVLAEDGMDDELVVLGRADRAREAEELRQ